MRQRESTAAQGTAGCSPGAGLSTRVPLRAPGSEGLEHGNRNEAGEMGPGVNGAIQWARPDSTASECDHVKLCVCGGGWGV